MRLRVILAAAAAAVVGLGVAWWTLRTPAPATSPAPRPGPSAAPDGAARPRPAPVPLPDGRAPEPSLVDWVALGGGAAPRSNEVSIEEDLALAREVLGPLGRTVYAGGQGTQGVQVRTDDAGGDPLVAQLADLFAPSAHRRSVYRATRLTPDAPADVDHVFTALDGALEDGGEPLLLLLVGHGDRGQTAADNALLLWGGWALTAADLAALLDEQPGRPTQVVATSCYSGGFAEIVFTAADEARGAAPTPRCGLFAATAEDVSSGCDPDPDRRRHQGYGVHFFNALRGCDRAGAPLPLAALDLDGDGRVSLLEAHTRARIAAVGFGVPTTTSERWLRARAPASGPALAVALVEEQAAIAGLTARLGLGSPEQAAPRLAAQRAAIAAAQRTLDAALDDEDGRYYQLAGELLARWPALDDPWHPAFWTAVRDDRAAIEAALTTSAAGQAWRAAAATAAAAGARVDDLVAAAAPLERLVRAFDTVALAGRLRAVGGADWATYEQLLACERSVPKR